MISIAREIGCSFDTDLGKAILRFWNTEITQISEESSDHIIDMEAGTSLDTPAIFQQIFSFFASIKTGIKLKQTDSAEYKSRIERRSAEWYAAIDEIADLITEKLDGRRLVIIYEDLDKLDRVDPDTVWDMFSLHAVNLCNFSFPVIYTFPISLSYDPKYGTLTGYFSDRYKGQVSYRCSDLEAGYA